MAFQFYRLLLLFLKMSGIELTELLVVLPSRCHLFTELVCLFPPLSCLPLTSDSCKWRTMVQYKYVHVPCSICTDLTHRESNLCTSCFHSKLYFTSVFLFGESKNCKRCPSAIWIRLLQLPWLSLEAFTGRKRGP